MIRQGFIFGLMLLIAQTLVAQKLYQLAPPLAKFESVFFDNETTLSFVFDQKGSNIFYTTDGSEPTTKSLAYKRPITISQHLTVLKAKSFDKIFAPSETIELQFFPQGQRIDIITTSASNPKYAGIGPTVLTDNKSGGTNHSNGAWLGFDSDSVVIDLSLKKDSRISKVLLHVLNNQGAWIFLPQRIDVYLMKNSNQSLLASRSFEATKETMTDVQAMTLDFPASMAKQLRIVVFPVTVLPDWHAGKGNRAWFFIDELKLY